MYFALELPAPNKYELDLSNEVLWVHIAFVVKKLHCTVQALSVLTKASV